MAPLHPCGMLQRYYGRDWAVTSDSVRIMIVEDDSDVAESVAELLRHAGYHVEVADNGEVALQRTQAEDFNITIMDVQMPVMNGADSCVEIKRIKPQARVVMMTGLDEWVPARATGVGAQALLRKPFSPQELMRLVDSVTPGRTN
jgi:DNA-binding response OmpR family regulator